MTEFCGSGDNPAYSFSKFRSYFRLCYAKISCTMKDSGTYAVFVKFAVCKNVRNPKAMQIIRTSAGAFSVTAFFTQKIPRFFYFLLCLRNIKRILLQEFFNQRILVIYI